MKPRSLLVFFFIAIAAGGALFYFQRSLSQENSDQVLHQKKLEQTIQAEQAIALDAPLAETEYKTLSDLVPELQGTGGKIKVV